MKTISLLIRECNIQN